MAMSDRPVMGSLGTAETPNIESFRTGLSWAAVAGGAVAAVSASLVLVALGSALGFASVSPWAGQSASLTSIGVGAVIWLVVTQWLASAFGGYLAGRLRTKWAVMSSDEVFFRDSAHGFLAWALATLIVFAVLTSAVGGGAQMAANGASVAAQGAAEAIGSSDYSADTLFRSATPNAAGSALPANSDVRNEGQRIVMRAAGGTTDPADRTYLAQLVSAHTGLSQADAEARVDQTVATAKEAAEAARKAATAVSFATALSLVIGAFVAAAAGALGGRHRDEI